ncbi:TonB-dependent receptor [Metapseudomonas otitidis]|uniref:TonB-dependent receptor n=1 Tax=Metapseudomonas otitidis TaxID=319939 RepID=A0A679GDB8_9GAMM|nr:TonB-dependent receptor [Pseudomonas otitidis]BCA28971.1 TonB-dependent receptor [Pseudomonas otitidis]
MTPKYTCLALAICACNLAYAAENKHDALELPTSTVNADREKQPGLDLDSQSPGTSRLGLSLRENPASVAVADREKIDRIGARNFLDVANALPGVNASAPPGWGGYVAYRGFNGAQVNQLFNGISLQYSAANRPVDAWIYDRVELVGGPSSFLHGSGSVGGSLNYITRLASREDSGEARIRYARFDDRETSIGINRALNDGPGPRHYARLDFSRNDSNGYIDRQERGASNVAFSLLSDLTDRLSHTLAVEYLEEKEDSPYWGAPTLNANRTGELKIDRHDRFSNYNVDDGRYEQRTRWLRSITDYQVDDATSLRNTFYHYEGQRDYRNLEVYKYNAAGNIARSSAYLQRHDQELNGNRLELLHKGELFGRVSDWAFGLDYSVNQQSVYPRSSSGTVDIVTPGNPDPGSFDDIPGMASGLVKARSNEVRTTSGFAENRQQLTDSLSLITALRYDHIELDATNHGAVSANAPSSFERRWDAITGRAGLVWQFTSDANLYVQYSTSAEPPGGTLTGASFTQVRDYDLSTGKQLEVGSKLDFDEGRGSATVAAYRIVRKDFPISDVNNPNGTVQAGQQTSDGVELAASYRFTPQWTLEGNVSWVDARFDDFNETVGGVNVSRKGKTPVNIPDRLANLWLTWEPVQGWRTGVDARYVSAVYANNANTQWVPSYTLYGAFVEHQLDANTKVSARLRNLTDEVYARFIHQSNAQYYLGEPRSLEVALDLRF